MEMSLVVRVKSFVSRGSSSQLRMAWEALQEVMCTSRHAVQSLDNVALVLRPRIIVGRGRKHLADAIPAEVIVMGELRYTMKAPPLRFRVI